MHVHVIVSNICSMNIIFHFVVHIYIYIYIGIIELSIMILQTNSELLLFPHMQEACI